MKIPGFKDVRLPAGAVPANWPLLLGIGLSVVLLIGILMTGEPVDRQDDPLDVPPAEPGSVEVVDPRDVSGVQADLDRRARVRAAEAAAEARRRAAEQERIQRQADAEARQRAAQLARAQEQLAILRARGQQAEQPEQRDPVDVIARTSGEADLLETLRLEDIARQVNARRAPTVVSSARGIGERQHTLREVDPLPPPRAPVASRPPAGPPAAGSPPPRGPAAPPPTAGPSFDPSVGAGVPRTRDEALGRRPPPLGDAGSAGRPPGGPLPGRRQAPAEFDLGPPADGGGSGDPSGVVVTPRDGSADRLYEGTMIPAVLQTRLDGEFSGPLSAQVTRHVYSPDRQRILVPRGTVALGESVGVEALWQGRIAVSFHRLLFPDGRWVRMEFAGMSGLGETSLRDQVDRHYLQLFGVAGAVGALAGFSQSGGQQGGYRSAAAEQISASALQIVGQFLNRLPTITIRAGHRVNIRLMNDLLIPREAQWEVVQ